LNTLDNIESMSGRAMSKFQQFILALRLGGRRKALRQGVAILTVKFL